MDERRRRSRRVVAVLVAALVTTGLGVGPAHAATRASTTTLTLSQTHIRYGEMVWLTGKVTSGGSASKARKVVVERRLGSGSWAKVATTTTSSKGTFTVRQRPTKEYTFRARALATATRAGDSSPARRVDLTVGARTLAARAKALGSHAGKATSSAVKAKVSGTKAVTYRSHSHGLLVQVTKTSGTVRTWFVYGDILTAYRKQGGPKGALGVPLADPKCGLIESGCVQRFQHGAIYDNKNTKKASVALGSGRVTEVIAAEKSQVGYKQKTYNYSKYNVWAGRVGAWCSVFQSWAATASGNRAAIPQHASWAAFLKDVRAHEKLGKTPKVGSLVFFDTISDGKTAATHVGMVVKVKKSTIVTIEANTSTPGSHGDGRGVYQKERPRSWALFYAYPSY